MKKFFFILVIVLLAGAAGVAILARRVPGMVVSALEKQLDKEIRLSGIEYRFPGTVEVRKLAILERNGEFKGETSFYVENILLEVNAAALLQRRVDLLKVMIQNPQITVRKHRGKTVHALSVVAKSDTSGSQGEKPRAAAQGARVPFGIADLKIRNGILKWIDYDIARDGFAVMFQAITADVHDLSLEKPDSRMTYDISADLVQTRDRAAAHLSVKGWTNPATLDTDAGVALSGLWLPYFVPYYQTVTASVLQDGTCDLKSTTKIERKNWVTNARLELSSLSFSAYEPDGKLFGFEAGPLMDILRSKSGRITLDLVMAWDLNDTSITFKKVVRRSIEQSIKATFLNNLDNVVGNTLERLSQDPDALKKDWKNVLGDLRKVIE